MNGQMKIDMGTYRQLMSNLAQFPRNVAFLHFRKGLNAWGGVVRNKARTLARRQTGLLQKSLTVKVKIPDRSYNIKHHGKPAYVMVGPSRRVVAPVVSGKKLSIRKATKRVLGGGRVQTRRPSRYAHLVERGHGGGQAHPFIGPAQEYGKTVGMDALFDKLRQGIAQAAAALPK